MAPAMWCLRVYARAGKAAGQRLPRELDTVQCVHEVRRAWPCWSAFTGLLPCHVVVLLTGCRLTWHGVGCAVLWRAMLCCRAVQEKNIETDSVAGRVGRIYMPKQTVDGIALAKPKGLRRERRHAKAAASEAKHNPAKRQRVEGAVANGS